ncbi:hypothetical protein [Spirillospora sp. CA-294931]
MIASSNGSKSRLMRAAPCPITSPARLERLVTRARQFSLVGSKWPAEEPW